jgi:hypothetical protein
MRTVLWAAVQARHEAERHLTGAHEIEERLVLDRGGECVLAVARPTSPPRSSSASRSA